MIVEEPLYTEAIYSEREGKRMKKKYVLITTLFVFLFVSMAGLKVRAGDEFVSKNPVIDVGDKIYVQHDENNNNVYDLKKSDTGTTVVYENILAEFTASKAWTTKGDYIDDIFTEPVGATSPEHYIPVQTGEEYFIKTYGVGWTGSWDFFYAPVLFLDENDNVVADALTNTFSKSKSGVVVTVPEHAAKMHLTMYGHQSFTLQKVLYLTDEEFDKLPAINRTELEAEIAKKYEAYKQDRTVYQKPDKAYITFVNDDTRSPMDQFADLFIEKKVPLVLATLPDQLIENASSEQETRLEVARRVEAAGGEIIAHNGAPLTKEGMENYNTMYSFFVKTKQMFNYYGFDVNGIILAGGSGQVVGAEASERWVSSVYSYSDLYGVEYDKKEIALDSVYYHYRGGLGNYKNDVDKIKAAIDDAIAKKTWCVFYFHDNSEISMDTLSQVLDYVNTKSENELELVTYKEMYQKNAVKESELINRKTTYYVSSTGTSSKGTDEKDPMSYETAQKKTYMSGDTILFKRGDTFYGTFNPTIAKVDDKITTISAYGEGDMPVLTGYKIADKKESWEKHGEGIYRINLKDTQYFSGLRTTDENSANIGFLKDENGIKFAQKKEALQKMEQEGDFYCDGTYLYMKCEDDPYVKMGTLKLATKTNLLILHSNLKIKNLMFSGTGAHGMVGSDKKTEHVEISYNCIQNIGGSYLKGTTRYGNGIEFYGTDAADITVKNNVIRNVYDVGFTIQGTAGSGENVMVKGNVFVSNSQDSEIWESGSATGVRGYEFTNNISVNAGRGWGYEARPDKYVVAHILFWGYGIENTDIYFHHNIVYHPRRLYFIEQTNKTNIFFKEKDVIRSDFNTYRMEEDATIFRDAYTVLEKDDFIAEYRKDANSVFEQVEADETILQEAGTASKTSEIKKLFQVEEEVDEDLESDSKTQDKEGTASESGSKTEEKQGTAGENGSKTEEKTGTAGEGGSKTEEKQESVKEKAEQQKTVQITDSGSKAVYRIKKNKTVEYVKGTDKKSRKVVIPATVTYKKVTYKVVSVASNAWKGNKNLTQLTIGKNVKAIGKKAFYGCKKLKKITIKSKLLTAKSLGEKAFGGIHKKANIKVPNGKKKSYKSIFILH